MLLKPHPWLCLLAFCLFCCVLFAQTQGKYEGDALVSFLGKEATSTELKDLKAAYSFEMANDAHYLSKGGLELIMRGNMLSEIHFYKGSAVYGNYTGKLPRKLKFGMSTSEVRHLLGKPAVSYNSGYCEYEYPGYVLFCWFDGTRLTQVGLAAKSS
jgi:hypothetical protein